jgi:hypothetical protein
MPREPVPITPTPIRWFAPGTRPQALAGNANVAAPINQRFSAAQDAVRTFAA